MVNLMLANMVTALNNALDLCLNESSDIIVLGEDVGKDGGVFRVTDGLIKKYGPDRIVDTPLAESSIIGTSIGMAIAGMHPFPEIQFGGFSYIGFDQLAAHAARYRSRTMGNIQIPMVVRMPVSGGVRTLEHHSESPEALFSHIGGLIVVEPSTPYDAKGLLIKAAHSKDPILFLEPTKLYRLFKQEIPDGMYEVPIGKANLAKEGDDLTIITYGTMAREVQKTVEENNISADVLDLRTINPIDESAIFKSVKKTGRALIVHEASLSFGVGAEISARIGEKCLYDLKSPVMRVGGFSFPYPFSGDEDYWVPNRNKVLYYIKKLMDS